MTTIFDETYLTITQAAEQLRVHPSTIRRWIAQGTLPAYRIGQRRVALKQADLHRMITPTDPVQSEVRVERPHIPPLTPEQQRRGLEAVERARHRQAELLARRGGKPFSPSWEILDELRDERSRQHS